ncbi:hypothetical protein F4805DRAFT_453168 [Annulohypoxylon moriforme]|nr:hypothetical protein F4805DRAFT_453168 [Annulohypoxylon moriforme]
MSQNQTPWQGDKNPNTSRPTLTQSERDQLQSLIAPPSTSPMQPTNQTEGQVVNGYGANNTSTSIAPQLTTSSAYGSAPPISNQQYSTPTPGHPTFTSMSHLYPNYGLSTGMGPPNVPASINPTFTYSHQQNSSVMPNTPSSQLNQWSSRQNSADYSLYTSQSHGSMNLLSSGHAQQNQISSNGQYSMQPASFSPSQAVENTAGPVTPSAHNGVSSDFNRASSRTPRVENRQNSRSSSDSNRNDGYRVSKSKGKAPLKWRPGMKEKKITDEMTPEEQKEASDWNYKFSEAKKAHTREQNRVSAQKSRQKKVELLERTRTQVEGLEEENARLHNHITGLDAAMQQMSTDNMHLQSQNEILRQRVALLEQQIQVQPVHNPHVALPAPVNQNQAQGQAPNLAPGVSQNQQFMQAPTPVPRQNPTPTQNTPQNQVALGYDLSSTQTAPAPVNNGPVDPTMQPQQTQTQQVQPQQLQQQPDNVSREAQDDLIYEWMQASMGEFPPDSDPNSRPWSPSNGGAQ